MSSWIQTNFSITSVIFNSIPSVGQQGNGVVHSLRQGRERIWFVGCCYEINFIINVFYCIKALLKHWQFPFKILVIFRKHK